MPQTAEPAGWILQLEGEHLDLRTLAADHPAAPIRVFEQNGVFLLAADTLDALQDAGRVQEMGRELLRMLFGISRVRNVNARPVGIAGVGRRYADGSFGPRTIFLSLRSDGRGGGTVSFGPSVGPTPSEQYWQVAERDSRVKSALDDFAGQPLDFPRLRRIYETLWTEYDPNQTAAENRIVAAGIADAAALGRFRNTVNRSPVEPTHSHFRYSSYADAMTREEATAFLAALLDRWIAAKI